MKLKILTSIAGERFSFNRGEVVEWPNKVEAKRWIAAGYAEAVPDVKIADKPKDNGDAEARANKGEPSEKADGKGAKGEKATLNR